MVMAANERSQATKSEEKTLTTYLAISDNCNLPSLFASNTWSWKEKNGELKSDKTWKYLIICMLINHWEMGRLKFLFFHLVACFFSRPVNFKNALGFSSFEGLSSLFHGAFLL
jgi:hypothetical protein